MTPRVTVLLPVYDAAPFLDACLRSIARQTESRFEVLIVDDGSTDESVAIAKRFAARDARFVVVERDHEGLIPTLEAGLDRATAPVVARMDADDCMHRHRLAAQLDALRDESLGAVGCRVRLFPRDNLTDGRLAYERWLNHIHTPDDVRREAFIECPIAHPTLAVRTALLRRLRYRDLGFPEDYDLVHRLLEATDVGVVPRRLLMWRDHLRRLSRNDPRYALERFTACRAHHLARSFVRGRDYVLWGFGHTGKALRKAMHALAKRVVAIVELHPGRLGQRIHGAPVIPPAELVAHRGTPILVSVAGASARAEIREAMRAVGMVEGRDYVCCA